MRRFLLILSVLLLTASVALLLCGCAITVRPPEAPGDPVSVMIVDHGRHASLILPLPKSGSVEYAYGEWEWFARANDPWYRAFPAMCWPTQGALGRRFRDGAPGDPVFASEIRAEERFLIAVERSKAAALLGRLNDLFESGRESELHNPLYALTFVKIDESYCLLNNCNQVLGRWLEEIGCDVSGSGCFADFRVLD